MGRSSSKWRAGREWREEGRARSPCAGGVRLGLGQDSAHPIRGKEQGLAAVPKSGASPSAEKLEGYQGIKGERFENELNSVPVQSLGQYHLAIVLGMHGVLGMFTWLRR